MSQTTIFVPGSLGSQIVNVINGNPEVIWLNPEQLVLGRFRRLKINIDGSDYYGNVIKSEVGDVIEPEYGKIIQALNDTNIPTTSQHVCIPFPYDWRQNVEVSATKLAAKIMSTTLTPINIITHSLGGMLARRAIQIIDEKWGRQNLFSHISNLIMLAPANYGTFIAAFGIIGATKEIPLVNMFPSPGVGVKDALQSFTALYQTLPWDRNIFPSLDQNNVTKVSWWKGLADPQRIQLANYQESINISFFDERTSVILGNSHIHQTAAGVRWYNGNSLIPSGFIPGDGFVPHISSFVEFAINYMADGTGHLDLPKDQNVIQACIDIINGKKVTTLPEYRLP